MSNMVHRCGPGPCKDCRLKSAEKRIAALESQLAAAQKEVQRLKKVEEALEHEQACGVELKRQLAEMPNLREANAAHVQTIREREEQLARFRNYIANAKVISQMEWRGERVDDHTARLVRNLAEEQIDALWDKYMRSHGNEEYDLQHLATTTAENTELTEPREQLAKMREFVRHKRTCRTSITQDFTCDCGLDAALDKPTAEKEKKS